VEEPGARLLAKVAQLYHLQGLNQDQIAKQVSVSRSKVSRMLKEARERGVVEISIRYPARFSLDLERRLESELGLREVVVVAATDAADLGVRGSVARAAADYLVRVLQPGDVLGVSGGETVALTAQVMPVTVVANVRVVQLGTAVAYLGDRAAYSSAEVAIQIAQRLGSVNRLVLIPIPSLLDNESIRDALLRDTGVSRARALLGSCSVALVGIGAVESESALAGSVEHASGPSEGHNQRPQVLPVTPAEVAELRSAGAVGEICSRFFDRDGVPCVTSLDRRMVALDLVELRAVPLVIGVASGRQKAAAILAAVRGGHVKSLVTDDATGAEVLALARAGVDAAGCRSGVGVSPRR
jgi:DNA-binding transcriptional regulator LsrR (DeoR family)